MGEPISLAEHVQSDPQFNYSAFSVSQTLLAYQAGAVTAGTRLISYDRSGKGNMLHEEPGLIQTIALSPSEDRLALAIGLSSGQLTDIWIYDLRTNSKAKLTFDQHSYAPVWSSDGTRIVFDRVTTDSDELVAKDVSSGDEEILFKLARQGSIVPGSSTPQRLFPVAWSSDGRLLIYRTAPGVINALPLKGDRKPVELLDLKLGIAGAALSPDGKWLAYNSNESGIPETYVPLRISPGGTPSTSGGKWQVSDGGGGQPFWRGDGKELFFSDSSLNIFMSTEVSLSADHLRSEKPRYLFDLDAHPTTGYYAVTRDGKRIYMVTYGPGSTAPITVTTNWTDLLKK